MDYQVLMLLRAARVNGVLDALATSPSTPAAVASETGITGHAARTTLDALTDQGFLQQDGDEYEATDRLQRLVTDDVETMSSLAFRLDGLDRWIALPETMRSGEPPASPTDYTKHYMGAMSNVDEPTVRACVTAAVREHPEAERVVDMGGGPGKFATEFVRRGREVTLVDRPSVIEIDEQLLADESISLVAGDIRESVPGEHDLAFCSRVVQTLSPEENQRLVQSAYDALAPGGSLVLIEVVRGYSPAAPTYRATMFAQADSDGDAYPETQYREWFDQAGFENVRIESVPGTKYQVVAGDR